MKKEKKEREGGGEKHTRMRAHTRKNKQERSDWNLIPGKCSQCPRRPAGTPQAQWELPAPGSGGPGPACPPPPSRPAADPSFRPPSLFQQKPSALLFQLLRAGLPAIVLGSLSVILGPRREDQTARKTLGSYKMFVIFVCCVEQKRHSGDSALFR